MKKILLFAVMSLATVTLCANPLKGWCPTRSDLVKANPNMIKAAADSITLTGIPKMKWMYFKPSAPVNAVKGQKVEITLTASGKGKVQVGYYEYKGSFNTSRLTVKNVVLTDKAAEQKIVLDVLSGETKIVRPIFILDSDSQIVVKNFAVKVLAPASAPAKK